MFQVEVFSSRSTELCAGLDLLAPRRNDKIFLADVEGDEVIGDFLMGFFSVDGLPHWVALHELKYHLQEVFKRIGAFLWIGILFFVLLGQVSGNNIAQIWVFSSIVVVNLKVIFTLSLVALIFVATSILQIRHVLKFFIFVFPPLVLLCIILLGNELLPPFYCCDGCNAVLLNGFIFAKAQALSFASPQSIVHFVAPICRDILRDPELKAISIDGTFIQPTLTVEDLSELVDRVSPSQLLLLMGHFGGVDTNLPSLALPLCASLPLDKCGASYDECLEVWLNPAGEEPLRFGLGFSDYEPKLREAVKKKALLEDGLNPGCLFHLGGRLKFKVEHTTGLGAVYKSRNTEQSISLQLAIGCYISSAWISDPNRWRELFPTFRKAIRVELVPHGLKGIWAANFETYFVKVWTGSDPRYFDLEDWLITEDNRYLRSQGKQERFNRDLKASIGAKKSFHIFLQGLSRQFELAVLRYQQMKRHGIFDNVRNDAIERERRIDDVISNYGGWEVELVDEDNVLDFLKELTCARKDWELEESDEDSCESL